MKSDKLCECGCGEFTEVIPKNNTARGWVKGEPRRFVNGHYWKVHKAPPPNPSGLCMCGCGETTELARAWNPPDVIKGEHLRFRKGHEKREPGPMWIEDENGCWIWQHGVGRQGYGSLRDGKTVRAHRWVYEREVGPIPEGHDLHHRCEVRLCVNPAHLEPLTPEQHVRLHRPWEAVRRAA